MLMRDFMTITGNLKKKINKLLLDNTGYRLTRSESVLDLRDVISDPREGIYRSKNMPFILELSFSNGGD